MAKAKIIGLVILVLSGVIYAAVIMPDDASQSPTEAEETPAEKPTFQRGQLQRGGAKEY